MKIRTDFVTNSSSSSFNVIIEVIDKENRKYSYTHYPIDNDNEDIGPVGLSYGIANEIKKSKNLDDLCNLLKEATNTYTTEEQMVTADELLQEYANNKEEFPMYPDYETWEKYLNKMEKVKDDFVNEIKKNNQHLEDIKKVNIIEQWFNTGEYMEEWNEDGFEEIEKITEIDLAKKQSKTVKSLDDTVSRSLEFINYIDLERPIELIVPPEKEFTNTAELISDGEKIELVRIYDNEDYPNSILIQCDKGKLGYLYISDCDILAPLMDAGKIKIDAYVESVTPLSKRSSRCRKPIILVKISYTIIDK